MHAYRFGLGVDPLTYNATGLLIAVVSYVNAHGTATSLNYAADA